MMIDIIAGLLSGVGYLNKVNKFYSDADLPMNVGHGIIAINASLFYKDFLEEMDCYIELMRNSKARRGMKIIVPGDRKKNNKESSIRDGIVLSAETQVSLSQVLIGKNATLDEFKNVFGV